MSTASSALNEFTLAFHKAVAAGTKGNIVFSPWSIMNGFAMVLAGAAGKTKEEILSVLKLDKIEKDADSETEVHKQLKEVDDLLRKSCTSKTYFEGANKVWIADGFKILDSYLSLIRSYYNVDVGQADFIKDSQGAIEEINKWVEEHTKQKIKNLFPDGSLDGMTKLALANAVYFKGLWETPFDKQATRKGEFSISDTEKVDVDMMFAKGKFAVYVDRTLQITVLELPYNDKKFSMLVLLPQKTDLVGVEKNLTSDTIASWKLQPSRMDIHVFLPKFKLDKATALKDALQAMGIQDAFSDVTADLSGVTGTRDLYVSCAFHKAFVEVDEEGTEAAAATGIGMAFRCMPMQIRVDRPFLFLIMEKTTSSILFFGKVMNPLE